MTFIKEKIEKYISVDSLRNISANWASSIGISCNLSLEENSVDSKRYIGRVIYFNNTDKVSLNQVVEFFVDKKQYQTSIVDNWQMFIIHPRFVRNYIVDPAYECVVEIYNSKNNTIEYKVMKMRFKQFFRKRLIEKTGDWSYRLVTAIENFNALRSKGRNFAINSTIRNYLIDKETLESHIGKYNTILREIKREWEKLIVESKRTGDRI